ncbi:10729_t:CDS:2, partial [Funneliformis geosporum]
LKLRIGDQRSFYLCNLFCKDIGKHHHIDYSQNEENSDQGNDRHKLKPDIFRKKDFISHELFWERTGFKDPYSVQEQKEFIIYEDSSNIKCSK